MLLHSTTKSRTAPIGKLATDVRRLKPGQAGNGAAIGEGARVDVNFPPQLSSVPLIRDAPTSGLQARRA